MKYKEKSAVIEAFQYNDDLKGRDMPDWAVKAFEDEVLFYCPIDGCLPCELFINDGEGWNYLVPIGNYIIQGVDDKIHQCEPDIFENIYEKVDE